MPDLTVVADLMSHLSTWNKSWYRKDVLESHVCMLDALSRSVIVIYCLTLDINLFSNPFSADVEGVGGRIEIQCDDGV